jgi:hypothetical protein
MLIPAEHPQRIADMVSMWPMFGPPDAELMIVIDD